MRRAEPALLIRVDHREVHSGVPERLGQMDGIVVRIESLDLGDYVLSQRVVVERKSAADLAASILDKRLFAQARQLHGAFERVIYLIEGAGLYQVSNLHPNAIRGALSYLVILEGVSLLRSEDAEDSAHLIATMARHEQQGLGYELSFHAKRRGESPALQMRYLVEDLPGIGPRMAAALLAHFGSLRSLFSASEEELRAVAGIGPKRASAIYELLSRPYEPA